MPKLRAAVAGLLIGITPAAVIAEPATDLSEAQRAFLDFRLTSDGRGMVMSPRATRKMQALANSPLWPMLRYNGERRGGMIPQGRGFVGLDVVAIGGTTTGLFSCVVCHAGKAAGQFAPGLGNKNIDAYAGVALLGAEWEQDRRSLRGTKLSAAERQATEGSLHYLKIASREGLANQTQGMVSVSPIFLWLYEAAGREFPPELSIPAAVKVPHLWGYDRKKEAGLFCDGMGDGSKPGWLAAVPLSSGFHPAAARNNYAKLLALDQAFGELKPPPYGFPVAERQARHGKAVFQHNCSGCHGEYRRARDGTPDYQKPRWIPIEVVQTDRERLALVRDDFHEIMERNPLGDIIRSHPQAGRRGYFAPRLEGIWARFPYLHNASVPNLAALLTPPEDRPKLFSLKRAGEIDRFDTDAVGLKVPPRASLGALALQFSARSESRQVYDTSRPGHSNAGHPFGTTLPANEKAALIEYLKTL